MILCQSIKVLVLVRFKHGSLRLLGQISATEPGRKGDFEGEKIEGSLS